MPSHQLTVRGFTLIELMVIVGIIALLAVIAIPSMLRSKMNSNDTMTKATLRTMSTAAESYANTNNGNYPLAESNLTSAAPSYLSKSYCGTSYSGFTYACAFAAGSYTLTAVPITVGVSGTTTYTMTTGGILRP